MNQNLHSICHDLLTVDDSIQHQLFNSEPIVWFIFSYCVNFLIFLQADLALVIFESKNILTENPYKINDFVILTASLCLWSIIILLQFQFWLLTMFEYFELKKSSKHQEVENIVREIVHENPMQRSRTNISVRDSIYQSNLSLNRELHRNSIYRSQMSIHNF